MQLRAIERGSVPPVFDYNLLPNKKQTNKGIQPISNLPNELLRGFFQTQQNESILDLKRRILSSINHSERCRRWWRRHMNVPVPLYSINGRNILHLIPNVQTKKYEQAQKIQDGNEISDDQQSQIEINSQGQQKQMSFIDFSTQASGFTNLSSFFKGLSPNEKLIGQMSEGLPEIPLMNLIGAKLDKQQAQERAQNIRDMIPASEEPDLSDLESTSEYNDIDEQEYMNENISRKEKQKEKQKQIKHKKDKIKEQINTQFQFHKKQFGNEPNGFDSEQRRTVRMQAEDFPVWVGLLKQPDPMMFDLDRHTADTSNRTEQQINAV
ncbi:MAG: hypothetical protein EZS28_017974 [Streblomastix strix]|uniref:Uncharacterized protein n=1 Tax=Streblomastix strix TaxID=222440 RepID=A0A5J4VW44_9EUKA|nr:MAG: hypothetical protein EZS28_017974 [Streblomastix strix]